MPTVNIQISDVKRIKNNISFTATTGNKIIERTINFDTVNSVSEFADWLINQDPDFELLPEKEKTLAITFHTETGTDPETGHEFSFKVIDDVIVS